MLWFVTDVAESRSDRWSNERKMWRITVWPWRWRLKKLCSEWINPNRGAQQNAQQWPSVRFRSRFGCALVSVISLYFAVINHLFTDTYKGWCRTENPCVGAIVPIFPLNERAFSQFPKKDFTAAPCRCNKPGMWSVLAIVSVSSSRHVTQSTLNRQVLSVSTILWQCNRRSCVGFLFAPQGHIIYRISWLFVPYAITQFLGQRAVSIDLQPFIHY